MFQELNFPACTHTDQGTGMPVIFVHGFCESKEIWGSFVEPLAANYRVICIDLPGFGENPPLTTPVTVGDLAEAIYQLLQLKGIDKCVLIGHSLGGYVSLAFAEKFPQRLLGLGLFHSTAYSDSFDKKQARTKTIEFVERYDVAEFIEEFVTPLFYEHRKKELKDAIRFANELGKKTPKSTVIEVIKAMRDRKDRTKVLEKSVFPVLFIAGRNDNAVTFTSSVGQFFLPSDATVHVLPNTGHMGMLERPAETQRMVHGFLEHIKLSEL